MFAVEGCVGPVRRQSTAAGFRQRSCCCRIDHTRDQPSQESWLHVTECSACAEIPGGAGSVAVLSPVFTNGAVAVAVEHAPGEVVRRTDDGCCESHGVARMRRSPRFVAALTPLRSRAVTI